MSWQCYDIIMNSDDITIVDQSNILFLCTDLDMMMMELTNHKHMHKLKSMHSRTDQSVEFVDNRITMQMSNS